MSDPGGSSLVLGGGQPPTASTNVYQLTLTSMLLPIGGHIAFNTMAALSCLLMGHPWVAAFSLFGVSLIDAGYQRMLRRSLRDSEGVPLARGYRKLALFCLVRNGLLLGPAAYMALAGGGAELAYMSVVVCINVGLACASGALSRGVFWAYAGPAMVGTAAVAIVKFPLGPAFAVLGGVLMLTLMLAMISEGTKRSIETWHAQFVAGNNLIGELQVARDRAVAERAAADEAREVARRATSAKSNFLATMSHEIRTPMNGVLGMAQLLRREEADPRQAARLDVLMESGEYLLSILNDILDVSKVDAGRLEISRQVENLPRFLQRTVSFWAAKADEQGVEIRLDIVGEAPGHVWMDALRLRQVLFNLIGNALKFTEAGSVSVRVEVRPDGEWADLIAIEVRDTGPGIAAGNLPALFEPFTQGDESEVRRFGGTGLGLAIAKQLTELMGGRIWATSQVGQGSRFHIELSLERAREDQVSGASATPSHEPGPPQASLDVLIVDDNEINLLVLEQLLTAFGHRAVKAGSGATALEQLAVRPFDLVCMDIQMPGMSGIQALNQLRARPGPNRDVPVIALTADVTSGGRARYLSLGFDEHCAKPIQIPDLVDAIARAVAVRDPVAAGVLRTA
jgi:signal transduction histidine kinase/CheY-like chemotaxis protein